MSSSITVSVDAVLSVIIFAAFGYLLYRYLGQNMFVVALGVLPVVAAVNSLTSSGGSGPTPVNKIRYLYAEPAGIVDYGAGKMSAVLGSPETEVSLVFSDTDANGGSADSYMADMAAQAVANGSITVTLRKVGALDYAQSTCTSGSDAGTYWVFTCTIGPFDGTITAGDPVTVEYI